MSRLKDYRVRLGLSQEELSKITGIPRSTISSIESGRVLPSVDYAIKLARALKCSVEELFTKEEDLPFPGFEEGLFTSYRVENKRILIPISLVEGDNVPEGYYRRGKIHWFSRKETITYAFAGCDPSLRIFSNLVREEGIRLLVINSSSLEALKLLKRGFVHIAGIHMGNFEDNIRVAKRVLEKGYKLLKLFSWEEGIILRRGLDIPLKELKSKLWLARERGSGARKVFDRLKKDLGIENYKIVSGGHEYVAFGVKEGFGDAGISIRLFAYEKGLDFISLTHEDYCLCYREEREQDKGFLKLLDLLRGKGYFQLLSHLPGYEIKSSEEVVL